MALTDGLICQIYPLAGDTAIKNIVDGSSFTGTGTPTLVDEGAEKAWRLTTGTFLTNPIPSTVINAGVDGTGTTIALRFKRVAAGSDIYLRFAGLTTSVGATNGGPHITPFDGNKYRGRVTSGLASALAPTAVANGNILTLVYRVSTLAASVSAPNMDNGAIWQNTVGRVGSAPDAVAYSNLANLTLTLAFLNCQTSAEFVLLDRADWNRPLTDAECASVADDYRGVMPSPGSSTTPIAFSGSIPAQTFTNGDAVSVNLSSYFSGTQTPFTFANTGTSLSGTGLSVSSSGVLTGTATTGSVTGVIITGTDADTNTASSNAFNVTVSDSAVPVSFTGTVPTLSGAENEAITPVDLSAYFSGSLTPFTYSLQAGSLPTGLSLNSSTGVISGTPTVDFSGSAIVRATDTGANTADTNSFLISIAAEAVPSFTLTDLCNNAGAPIASTSGITVDVYNQSTGALVVRKTGLTSTAGADVVVSDAALSIGTEYNVFITIGTAIGAVKATAA